MRPVGDRRAVSPRRPLRAAVALFALSLLTGACGRGGAPTACDDSKVQAAIIGDANQKFRMTNLNYMMTGLSQISTVGREGGSTRCAATAAYSSGTAQHFTYLISPNGEVRDLKDASAAGGD